MSLWEQGSRMWEKIPPAWKFSLVSVTWMRVFYTLWSLVFLSSSFSPVIQNQEFFGEPVLTVFDLQTSRSHTFNRLLNGDLLTFQKLDATHLIDMKTGSIWQAADGKSVSGFTQERHFRLPVLRLKDYSHITVFRHIPLHSLQSGSALM